MVSGVGNSCQISKGFFVETMVGWCFFVSCAHGTHGKYTTHCFNQLEPTLYTGTEDVVCGKTSGLSYKN